MEFQSRPPVTVATAVQNPAQVHHAARLFVNEAVEFLSPVQIIEYKLSSGSTLCLIRYRIDPSVDLPFV